MRHVSFENNGRNNVLTSAHVHIWTFMYTCERYCVLLYSWYDLYDWILNIKYVWRGKKSRKISGKPFSTYEIGHGTVPLTIDLSFPVFMNKFICYWNIWIMIKLSFILLLPSKFAGKREKVQTWRNRRRPCLKSNTVWIRIQSSAQRILGWHKKGTFTI